MAHIQIVRRKHKKVELYLPRQVPAGRLPVGHAAVGAAREQLAAARLEAHAHEQRVGVHHLAARQRPAGDDLFILKKP